MSDEDNEIHFVLFDADWHVVWLVPHCTRSKILTPVHFSHYLGYLCRFDPFDEHRFGHCSRSFLREKIA